jgi:Uma2 family endonuclease
MSQSPRREVSIDAFWAIPEAERFHEFYGGELVPKAVPSGEHGGAQVGVAATLAPCFQRRAGSGGPGGWWIATEVEVKLDTGEVVRPDVLGWRRERCAERPTGTPVQLQPDWVCEILSPENAKNDTVKKLRLYHRVGIPHYWLLDPRDSTLTVMRWSQDGFVTILRAERHETVHAEPFDTLAITVSALFGDDPIE